MSVDMAKVEDLIKDELEYLNWTVHSLMTHPVCIKHMFAICEGKEVSVLDIPQEVLDMENFNVAFYVGNFKLAFQGDLVTYLWVTKYQESFRKKKKRKSDA